jgi:hypothetical protein
MGIFMSNRAAASASPKTMNAASGLISITQNISMRQL